jgi:hypothetical protein
MDADVLEQEIPVGAPHHLGEPDQAAVEPGADVEDVLPEDPFVVPVCGPTH